MTKRQIRISDTHFKELESLCVDLGLKKAEVMGLALSLLRSLKTQKAKSLKVTKPNGEEVEIALLADLTS